MTLTIRKITEEDGPAVSRICLLTGDAGQSAEAQHDFGELPGLVYAVPYTKLPTTWGFVLADDTTSEVVGYVLGSTDTRVYEKYTAEHWWPALAAQYPPAMGAKPADLKYMNMFRDMRAAAPAAIAFSPAHLHINILETCQRRGWGRKLIARAVEFLNGEGIERVWLGLDPRNHDARKFYERIGFTAIAGADEHTIGLVSSPSVV
ncbi:acyl-CoA N-acyltransferase [Infundibulicybe gibba]|nr:acyl-CoA N-acyltransferase [Infundibulicybe gibba]